MSTLFSLLILAICIQFCRCKALLGEPYKAILLLYDEIEGKPIKKSQE